MFSYKPLTNNAVQEMELVKYVINSTSFFKEKEMYMTIMRLYPRSTESNVQGYSLV
jgi:hypothetical protein